MAQKYNNDMALRARVEQITESMPERYRTIKKLQLAEVDEIERGALQEYRKDPKRAIDKPQLLKQIKQAAGIDLNEQQPITVQNINIAAVQQNIMNALQGDFDDSVETVDAEVAVIDDKTGEGNESD